MAHEIAVILDKSGNTATLSVQGKVVLFSRKMGEWKISRVREFTLSDVQGMSDLRCKMDELKEFLGDCSNFVALKMEGLPGSILEKNQCNVWERTGDPADFLDEIRLSIEQSSDEVEKSGEQQNSYSVNYVEKSPGNYVVIIKDIQEKDLGITSKQALLPFLKKGGFKTLEATFNHLPPWLEQELVMHNLKQQVLEEGEGLVKILIDRGR